MKRLWHSFLLVLATATDRELASMIEYLKAENRILRSKLPRRVDVTVVEKRQLLKLGKRLGAKLAQLITIVSPRTFARWLAAETNGRPIATSSRGGRPQTAPDVKALVLRFASENGWGFGRIVGELKKLGITIGKTTVKQILRENGFDVGPKRGQGTWSDFVERHAKTLWACDFFQRKIWTSRGPVDYLMLFFIHVGSRRVYLAGIAANPTSAWVVQQARNMAMIFQEEDDKPEYLIRDNDNKYPPGFNQVMSAEGVNVIRTAVRAPNMNAYIERWIQSLGVECLDHFVVFGEAHLRYLVTSYVDYHNKQRPHQSLNNLPLDGRILAPPADRHLARVVCEERLGGLLKAYSWRGAA